MLCDEPYETCNLFSYPITGKEGYEYRGYISVNLNAFYEKRLISLIQ